MRKSFGLAARPSRTSSEPVDDPPRAPESPGLAALSESARQFALDRFGLLRPCLEDGVPLAHVARQHGLHLRSLQRWLRAYRRHGLAGLARKPYPERGHRLLSGPRSTQISSTCCTAARRADPTRCGKPTIRPWTCGCSTNAVGRHARG